MNEHKEEINTQVTISEEGKPMPQRGEELTPPSPQERLAKCSGKEGRTCQGRDAERKEDDDKGGF